MRSSFFSGLGDSRLHTLPKDIFFELGKDGLCLTQREIFRIVFQGSDGIYSIALDIQRIERLDRGLVQSLFEDSGQPGSFSGEGLAHHVLQKTITRHDDAAALQIELVPRTF